MSILESLENTILEKLSPLIKKNGGYLRDISVESFASSEDVLDIISRKQLSSIVGILSPQGNGTPFNVLNGPVASQRIDVDYIQSLAIINISQRDDKDRRKPVYEAHDKALLLLKDIEISAPNQLSLGAINLLSVQSIDVPEFFGLLYNFSIRISLSRREVVSAISNALS